MRDKGQFAHLVPCSGCTHTQGQHGDKFMRCSEPGCDCAGFIDATPLCSTCGVGFGVGGRTCSECGPLNALHNMQVRSMLESGPHEKTGRYLDPVSGRLFPANQVMRIDPCREDRRRLKKWRRSGRAPGGQGHPGSAHCPVVSAPTWPDHVAALLRGNAGRRMVVP